MRRMRTLIPITWAIMMLWQATLPLPLRAFWVHMECARYVTGQSSGSFRSFKSSPVSSVQARYFTCCQLSIALNVPPVLSGNSIKKDLFEGSPCVTALGKRIFNFLMASSLETLRKGSAAGITRCYQMSLLSFANNRSGQKVQCRDTLIPVMEAAKLFPSPQAGYTD